MEDQFLELKDYILIKPAVRRKIITTSDGSSTLYMEDLGETYHSIHGAIQEANHVYIQNGLERLSKKSIQILEIGFGTGLNFYLTYLYALENNIQLQYVGLEAYPLEEKEWKQINYQHLLPKSMVSLDDMHKLSWGEEHHIINNIKLIKIHNTVQDFTIAQTFDLIYFDAFGYDYQPELWSKMILEKMFHALNPGGILVTYACKGIVNRTLKEIGFEVEKHQGPPGKREMTVAYKVKKSVSL